MKKRFHLSPHFFPVRKCNSGSQFHQYIIPAAPCFPGRIYPQVFDLIHRIDHQFPVIFRSDRNGGKHFHRREQAVTSRLEARRTCRKIIGHIKPPSKHNLTDRSSLSPDRAYYNPSTTHPTSAAISLSTVAKASDKGHFPVPAF